QQLEWIFEQRIQSGRASKAESFHLARPKTDSEQRRVPRPYCNPPPVVMYRTLRLREPHTQHSLRPPRRNSADFGLGDASSRFFWAGARLSRYTAIFKSGFRTRQVNTSVAEARGGKWCLGFRRRSVAVRGPAGPPQHARHNPQTEAYQLASMRSSSTWRWACQTRRSRT